jgi:DNA-binding NtrC family response regulator
MAMVARRLLAAPLMATSSSVPAVGWRKVLLVVEDASLSDVLGEALVEAGHSVAQIEDAATAPSVLAEQPFDTVLVDLDTRTRDGDALIARLRAEHPAVTIIALLPCGGSPPGARTALYHVGIEKPARLNAVLSAVHLAHAAIRS